MSLSKSSIRTLSVLLLSFSGVFPIAGQEFRSTLSGQVTDSSGASIANATIEAVRSDSQQTYRAVSTKAGSYYIPYVLPGEYTVTVMATGFNTRKQEHVTLRGSETTGLNFTMQIGATSETITVSAAPPLLETETGSGGTVLNEREIQNLPLNGRQIYTLLGTTPGSQFTQTQFGAGGYSGTRGWDTSNAYTLGGGVAGYQQFYINGTNITVQNNGTRGTWTIAPNVDALQEVNLLTTTYDARFGRSGGGSVNMVVKQGSNAFHGEVYDYLENGALNANVYQNNLNGQPRQNLHQNQFGGTFGGAVKKDKIFFFGSYEGYRETIPFSTLESVPPAYLRPQPGQGVDFTQTGFSIYDPNTTFCTVPGGTLSNCPGSAFGRQQFPNNTIPASRINPIGAAVLNLYPLPNTSVTGTQNNFIANLPDHYKYDQPLARVDYNTSDKMRWYSLFAYQHGTEFRNSNGFPPPAENGNINQIRQALVASEDMTYTFSPTLVGDFKGSFVRYIEESPNGDLTTSVSPSTLGLTMPSVPTAIRPLLPQFTTNQYYPQVVGNQLNTQYYNVMSFDSDFTKTISNHTIHWGGEIQELQYANPRTVGSPNGDFTFGSVNTQYNPQLRNQLTGVNDGFDVADMLLGDPAGGGVDYNRTLFAGYPAWALYGQDDWHVTHRLTITIGLRYDVQVGVRERYNGLNRGLCLTCVNPITNDPGYQANLAADGSALSAAGINPASLSTVYGGVLFAGAKGQPRDAYNTDFTNIQPRFGFAYQLDRKTVIRGGWGLMYAVGLEGGTTAGFSQNTGYISSLNSGATPTNYFASGNPFPNGAQAPPGNSLGLLTNVGNGISVDFPQRRIPRSQIVSLGFQRELPGHMVLDARFAGNFTNRLRVTTSFNSSLSLQELQAGIANSNLFNQQVPNPYYNISSVPATSYLGSHPTVNALQLLLPLSQYPGALGDYTNPLGTNDYKGLEVKLEKRLDHGISFRLAYTYSKTMNATSYQNYYPYQDKNTYREIAGTDRTHVFSLTANWDLPVGKGRALLPSPNRLVSALVSGWSISPVLSVQTGTPVGLNTGYYYNCNHSYTPDGGPSLNNYIYNDYSGGSTLGCYSTIPQYGLHVLPDRIATLRNPSIPNLDLSLQKDFDIREHVHAKLRADAFNITNSVLFGGPDTNPNDGPPVQQANGSYTGYGTVGPTQQNFPRILQVSLKVSF